MTFLSTLAAMRGRPDPAASYSPYLSAFRERSIDLTDGTSASYTQVYHENVWVKAAVDAIALSLTMMPIHTYVIDGDAKQRQRDGGLYRLMERRPMIGWTPSRYREFIGKNVAIYGNAIIVKLGMTEEGDEPTELMPAPAHGWSVKGDTYYWTAPTGGDPYPFKRWQIIHYRFWDTDSNGFGASPIEALRKTVSIDDAARRYAESSFRHGSRPGAILRTDKDLAQPVADALSASWKTLYGGVDNAFKTAILTHGLDYATYESDLEKSAVVAHRDYTPVEVAAAYRLPASMIGWTKEANFASVDMFHTMLYQDSLGPWVVMVEETTQLELVEPCTAWANQFVEIEMKGVMRGDAATQYRNYATGITTGFLTPNEVRAMENLPPSDQPEANQLLFPMNLSGAVGAQLSEDNGQEDKRSV